MQTGDVIRLRTSWAYRLRLDDGRRPQISGFRTKGEARTALNAALAGKWRDDDAPAAPTFREVVAQFLTQHDASPGRIRDLRYRLSKAVSVCGDRPVRDLRAAELAAWRAEIPPGHRHEVFAALRQVLGWAVRMELLDTNPALAVRNPVPKRPEIKPFATWDDVEAAAAECAEWANLVIFAAGTGLRPEEWIALDWGDVDLGARAVTVRRAYSRGRLTPWGKTDRSRRRVPLRARVLEALNADGASRRGLVFPAQRGGYIDLHNFRARIWIPAMRALDYQPRPRIYDLRHTYATFSLRAGISLFTLARRMGTSVEMIDRTYGHLAIDADDHELALLDAHDKTIRVGRDLDVLTAERSA